MTSVLIIVTVGAIVGVLMLAWLQLLKLSNPYSGINWCWWEWGKGEGEINSVWKSIPESRKDSK